MSITDQVMNGIRKDINKISPNAKPSILLCRINKVNPEKLTADIYVNEVSTILYNVPICFPSKGRGYGSYFMPKEGGTYIVMFTSKNRPYILASAQITNNDTSQISVEKLLPGENTIQGIGGGFLRQDVLGNNILSSSFGNSLIVNKDGTNRNYSLGKEDKTIASKEIYGFGIESNVKTEAHMFNTSQLKTVHYSEYYSLISVPKVYTSQEILNIESGTMNIKQDIKNSIILSAKQAMEKITEFKSKVNDLKNEIQNPNLEDSELEIRMTQAITSLKSFNIPRKGVKITIEKGNVLNRDINNINDIKSLQASDFVASDFNKDICLRLLVKDVETNNTVASAYIDTDGNCKVKFKKLIIDADIEFTQGV